MGPELIPRENSVHWSWLVYLEMFVAGVAAGAYLVGAALEWLGRGSSSTARVAHLIAFPLMALAGILLIVDLSRPERFWHMVVMSEYGLPILKSWSPISYGSWLVLVFGAWTFISFLDALIARRVLRFGRWWRYDRSLHGSVFGRIWSSLGALLALGVGIYSGVLLSVSNIAGWSQSTFIPPVYMATALVTGVAAVVLVQAITGPVDADVLALWGTNRWLIIWWLIVVLIFLAALLAGGAPFFLSGPPLVALVLALLIGGVAPLLLSWQPRAHEGPSGRLALTSVLVLLGGLLLRYAIVSGPQQFLGR